MNNLIQNGANINSTDDSLSTPLHIALKRRKSNVALLLFLLHHGADVNAADNYGWTPLLLLFCGNARVKSVTVYEDVYKDVSEDVPEDVSEGVYEDV